MELKRCHRLLIAGALAIASGSVSAQGLEGIVVEQYHTVTQADADYYNNNGGGSYALPVGATVYRVYVDMAPGYQLSNVFGSPEQNNPPGPSLNPLDVTTTTTFWNEDDRGNVNPGETRYMDDATLFDSYLTINRSGAHSNAGSGACPTYNLEVLGVPRNSGLDTDGDLTSCGNYPDFPGAPANDGNIPGTALDLQNFLTGPDLSAFSAAGSQFTLVNDAWATLPAQSGVDSNGQNLALILQLTTDGALSFHLNVTLKDPNGGTEVYVWNSAGLGETVSPALTYPPVTDCEGTVGGPALPGTSCDDGDFLTVNDTWDNNCVCVGEPVDCLNVPNGTSLPGTACDDVDPSTYDDTWDNDCNCVGTPYDCPNLLANIGDACDDMDPNTTGDAIDANCVCTGTSIFDCPNLMLNIGDACDDGDAGTYDDTVDANCVCAGTPYDCPNLMANIGDACDDMDPNTSGDAIDANCVCTGSSVFDCPNLMLNIGDACDDGDAGTYDDTVDANCVCAGTPYDCPNLMANIGDACDDMDPNTSGDAIDANCVCTGSSVFDCPNLMLNIGDACDDGDAGTYDDTVDANCVCAGTPYDCPNLMANIGDACDDMDPNTSGDAIDANCVCTGSSVFDCPNLMLNIGDACDDGDAGTYDDTVDANCVCAGTPYDCPNLMANIGDACDDMDPNTSGDVVDANCVCAGSSVFDCPNLGANIGDACDDGDAGTYDDTVDANCVCAGTPYDCPNLMANIGDACDDMDPNTTGDVVNANCVCVGTPVGGCTETLTLEITLDDFGSETTWELYDDTGLNLIDMGGPYQDGMAGTVVTETLCLDQTCYRLVVNDDGGNGITDGGYVLTDANGRRIVDANGLFGSTSSVTYPFCLPLSNQGMINAFCDRMDLTYASSTQFYAHYQPGASGYQWWIFDPHGTYSRRVYRTTQNLIPTYLVTLPVPADLDLNVRVRALIGGNYTDFGPACRVRLNSPIGQRNLIDLPNGAALSVYPNPNRTGLLFVDLDQLGEGMHHVQIDLYNAMGQQVYAQQLSTEGDKLQQQLQLDHGMAAGLYTIIVTADGSQLSDRVVIE